MYVLTSHCINPIIQCKKNNQQRVTHPGQWQWPSLMFIWKLIHTWVFPKIGVPQNGWFIMENPIKMDDLGVSLFLKTHPHMVPLVQLAILLCLEVWGALTIWPSRLLSNFPTFQSAWRQFEILLESPGKKKGHTAVVLHVFVVSFKFPSYFFYLCIRITWNMLVLNRWLLVPKFCVSKSSFPPTVIESSGSSDLHFHLR